MNRRRLWSVGTALSALTFTTPLAAWDNDGTHPYLMHRITDWLCQVVACGELEAHARFNMAEHENQQCQFIDEGAVKEDMGLSPEIFGGSLLSSWDVEVWGKCADEVSTASWQSHAYDPLTGECWYDFPDLAGNAKQHVESIWAYGVAGPIGFFRAGRISHLLHDMASPAHTHSDFHATGDDTEAYAKQGFQSVQFSLTEVRRPSTHGLVPDPALPHPDGLQSDTIGSFVDNVAWRTYYMTSYYVGDLVKTEGDHQPDSELKRMFPYDDGNGSASGLRYDTGGWFGNDAWIIDEVGYNWIGFGFGNSEWWHCPGESQYVYLENLDGDYNQEGPSEVGDGVAPVVFKADPFHRVLPTDDLDEVLAPNDKIFTQLYTEQLFAMSSEWVAGFLLFFKETREAQGGSGGSGGSSVAVGGNGGFGGASPVVPTGGVGGGVAPADGGASEQEGFFTTTDSGDQPSGCACEIRRYSRRNPTAGRAWVWLFTLGGLQLVRSFRRRRV